jgi:protein-tyrosine phosphatase
MAEALFGAWLPAGWRNVVAASSAGTAAREGEPASLLAVEVLREDGIDLSTHRSRLITREAAEGADVIVVMERRHRNAIDRIAPGAAGRVIVFGELDGERDDPDVEDPIGGDRAVYERTKRELERLTARFMDYLAERYRFER